MQKKFFPKIYINFVINVQNIVGSLPEPIIVKYADNVFLEYKILKENN